MVGKQPRLSKPRTADIGVLKLRSPVSTATPNACCGELKECQGLFKVSSPPPPETEANPGFLERCHYCHRSLAPFRDLFMYGSLRAYCTAECRLAQMERDNATSEPLRKPCVKSRR